MKNSLLKGAHLSEKKCREMLHLFSEDLTATQIANATGISRVTVNGYLKRMRIHIAKFCEEKNPRNNPLIIPPVFNSSSYSNEKEAANPNSGVFGFLNVEGKVYANWIADIDQESLSCLQQLKYSGTYPVPPAISGYQAIADFEGWDLYYLEPVEKGTAKNETDDITGFWGNTKSRLMKFRGLNKNTLYLHVKESEFRYNYRYENMDTMLQYIIQNQPMPYSGAWD